MSVTINTNYAAMAAANNLGLSQSMLQRSLNRLSSGSRIVNPSDDAGGVAVSMRLSANAKRSASAETNISNAISLLQNQDGAIKVAGKIVERMAELQSLWDDATKNTADKALYDIEFHALQDQLTNLSGEKFNGVNMFSSSSTNIITNAAGDQTLNIAAKNLGTPDIYGSPTTLSAASGSFPVASTSGGTLVFDSTNVVISSSDTLAMIVDKINAAGADVTASDNSGQLKLTKKTNGTETITATGPAATLSALGLTGRTPALGVADTKSAVQLLLTATSLGDTGLNDKITAAQDKLAGYRAHNGAEQNGLNFASELLSLNKVNLEAAAGRINDVDVAAESTQLAKWTTLTQAGTAMLAQANQSTSLVLKLMA